MKIRFQRVMDIINSPFHLYKKLVYYAPMNAYFTPVKWLNPIYVAHSKDELDIMLSSPLYFDIDMKDLNPPIFSEAKNDALKIIQFIEDEYQREPDLILFSGRQGFHLHYWDWDSNKIIRLNPKERMDEFKKSRNLLMSDMMKRKIIADITVTNDPFRIMKIPNTLHGKTGLIARPVKNIKSFDPRKDAVIFKMSDYENIFKINWSVYE